MGRLSPPASMTASRCHDTDNTVMTPWVIVIRISHSNSNLEMIMGFSKGAA